MSFHLSHSMSDISAPLPSRSQSVKLEYRIPKPVPSLRSRTMQDEPENIQPANQTSHRTQPLSSSDCGALTRASEPTIPPKLPRSMSLCSNIGRRATPTSDDDYPLKLETIPNKSPKSITVDQVAQLLEGSLFGLLYDRVLILDARFGYEYEGGHILGAQNVYLPEHQEELKETLLELGMGDRLCIVIHCEFSSRRGPKLYEMLRKFDRELNSYPKLHFPEMYVLNGGYKEFFSRYPNWCVPDEYVPMHHRDYTDQLWEAMRLTKSQGSVKSKSLTRSSSDMTRLHTSPLFGGNRESRGTAMETSTGAQTEQTNSPAAASAAGVSNSGSAVAGQGRSLSAQRVLVSVAGKQDVPIPLFSFNRPSSASLGSTQSSSCSSTTMDTSSDNDDDEDADDTLLSGSGLCSSPTPSLRSTRRAGIPRLSAPTRGASFHVTPMRYFNFSTPNLPNFAEAEDDEESLFQTEMAQGPFTSR